MHIELTEEQYRDLVELVVLGNYVRGGVADIRGESGDNRWEKIEQCVLFAAINDDITGVAEMFHGQIVPTDELDGKVEEMMEEYDNDEFWHELEVRLGQRDFYREIIKDDLKYIEEHHGVLPERINSYYQKYEDEFDEHDIDRLEIKK